MNKLAVLFTCFNRKEKTLSALATLEEAFKQIDKDWEMSVYLTDDASTDGTSEAVSSNFPKVNILKGDGSLYWAGGMRNSWNEALKGDYDAYLLLNDDTIVYSDLFTKILETDRFCKQHLQASGVYIGTTIDSKTKKVSYGGSVFKNRFLGTMKRVPLDHNTPKECELGNANIMWVPSEIVEKIGILSKGYVHGMADYDYTMKAVKKKLPVLIMPGVSGECVNDHGEIYEKFVRFSLKERIGFLYNPVGLDFSSQVYHMRRHFPLRLPMFYAMGWFKVFFPKIYFKNVYRSRLK